MRTRLLMARVASAMAGLLSAALVHCSVGDVCVEGEAGCALDPCANGVRDGTETDVDCGGACGACATGAACAQNDDCRSNRCLQSACCEAPCIAWSKTAGGIGLDHATSAVVLSDGTIVVAGQFAGTVDFGGGARTALGDRDIFVAAYDAEGGFRYDRQFGGKKDDLYPRLARGKADRIWMTGMFASKSFSVGQLTLTGSGGYLDAFLAELGASGDVLRAHAYSSHGTTIHVSDVVATPDGGVVMTGNLGAIDFGGGALLASSKGSDVFLAKLDARGQRAWSSQFGSEDDAFAYALALGEDAIYLDAIYRGAGADFGGPKLPDLPQGGAFGLVVARYGLDGQHVWSRGYDLGTGASDIAVDDADNLFATGPFSGKVDFGSGPVTSVGTTDLYIVKLDPRDGTAQWTVRAGDNQASGQAVAADGAGGVLFGAQFTGTVTFEGGIRAGVGVDSLLLGRVSHDGAVEWASNAGGILVGGSIGLTSTPQGRGLVFGGYAGALEIGGRILPSGGKFDAYLLSFVP